MNAQSFQFMREQIAWAFDSDTKAGCLHEGSGGFAGFGSKCLLPPWAFTQKPFVVAVNKLSKNDKALLFFTTSLAISKTEMTNLMLALWFEFYKTYHVSRRMNGKTLPKAQRLLEWAFINYKNELDGKPQTKQKDIMEAIEVNDLKTFKRDWLPRLAIMKQLIASKEEAALSQVLSQMDDRRKQHYA